MVNFSNSVGRKGQVTSSWNLDGFSLWSSNMACWNMDHSSVIFRLTPSFYFRGFPSQPYLMTPHRDAMAHWGLTDCIVGCHGCYGCQTGEFFSIDAGWTGWHSWIAERYREEAGPFSSPDAKNECPTCDVRRWVAVILKTPMESGLCTLAVLTSSHWGRFWWKLVWPSIP